jgi:hypothetical protein
MSDYPEQWITTSASTNADWHIQKTIDPLDLLDYPLQYFEGPVWTIPSGYTIKHPSGIFYDPPRWAEWVFYEPKKTLNKNVKVL